MGTKRFDELNEMLHQMPLPDLDQQKGEKIYTKIIGFNRQHQTQSRKQRILSRWGISLASIVAVALLLFFTVSYFGLPGSKESTQTMQNQEKNNGQPEESINTRNNQLTVVKQWAEGVKQRDGKMQYEQFSSELKEKYQKVLEATHWVTGPSSPWVKGYKISDDGIGSSDTQAFKVVFDMTSSTGDAEDIAAIVYLEKVNQQWVISRTSSSTNYLVYDLTSNKDEAEPQTVVNEWADGVKKRDGKQQFKMLAPILQKKYLEEFEQRNWSTGTSSPWVNKIDIKKDSAQANVFHVTFQMASSTGSAGDENAVVHLEKNEDKWVITEITSDNDEFNMNLNQRG